MLTPSVRIDNQVSLQSVGAIRRSPFLAWSLAFPILQASDQDRVLSPHPQRVALAHGIW